MSAKVFGLGIFDAEPGPDFRYTRDKDGKVTGSRSFTLLKESKDLPQMQAKFARGKAITTLCPDLGPFFAFLELSDVEFEDIPGGLCVAYASFDGYSETGEYGFDREVTYSMRGVMTERPIIEHPNYIAEVKDGASGNEHQAIVGLYNGTAYAVDPTATNPKIVDIRSDSVIITALTDTDPLKWYNIIFIDGVRTYEAPAFEWTRSTANAAGLASSDIAKLGKYDSSPDGSPPTPTGATGFWRLVDLADERGSNSSSNSLTWRWMEGDITSDKYAKLYNY